MARDPIVRRRKLLVAVAVLTVGIVMSALLALALIHLASSHPGP